MAARDLFSRSSSAATPYYGSDSTTYNLTEQYDPSLAMDLESVNRRQRLIDAMLTQTLQPLQATQAGRFIVPPGWGAGIGQMLSAGVAGYLDARNEQKRRDIERQNADLITGILGEKIDPVTYKPLAPPSASGVPVATLSDADPTASSGEKAMPVSDTGPMYEDGPTPTRDQTPGVTPARMFTYGVTAPQELEQYARQIAQGERWQTSSIPAIRRQGAERVKLAMLQRDQALDRIQKERDYQLTLKRLIEEGKEKQQRHNELLAQRQVEAEDKRIAAENRIATDAQTKREAIEAKRESDKTLADLKREAIEDKRIAAEDRTRSGERLDKLALELKEQQAKETARHNQEKEKLEGDAVKMREEMGRHNQAMEQIDRDKLAVERAKLAAAPVKPSAEDQAAYKAGLKALERDQKAVDQATAMEADLLRWNTLNARTETGPIAGRRPVSFNPDYEELQQLENKFGLTNYVPGQGQVSNFERGLITGSGPRVTNVRAANANIIRGKLAGLEITKERAAFRDWYLEEYRKLSGADKEWSNYIQANPVLIPDKNGQPIENPHRMDWMTYFTREGKASPSGKPTAGPGDRAPAASAPRPAAASSEKSKVLKFDNKGNPLP